MNQPVTLLAYERDSYSQRLLIHYATEAGCITFVTDDLDDFQNQLLKRKPGVLVIDFPRDFDFHLLKKTRLSGHYIIGTTANDRLTISNIPFGIPVAELLLKPIARNQYRSAIASAVKSVSNN